jgi:ABC-type oligopeptide transport system substrate-binding subunit
MIAIGKMLGDVGIRCDMQFPNAAAAVDLRTEGWDGLYAATVRTFSNTQRPSECTSTGLSIFSEYVASEEMGRVFIQARSTKEVQEDLVAELHRMTLENLLCIPVYNTKDNYLIRENVHDAGFGEWGAGTQYRLDIAWKSAG